MKVYIPVEVVRVVVTAVVVVGGASGTIADVIWCGGGGITVFVAGVGGITATWVLGGPGKVKQVLDSWQSPAGSTGTCIILKNKKFLTH